MSKIVNEAQQRLVFMIEEHQAEIILPSDWPVAFASPMGCTSPYKLKT